VELIRGQNPVVVVSPHPLVPAKDRHFEYVEFYPRETLADYLVRRGLQRRFGLDGRRPVVCTIQGLRVPRELWSHVRPKPGYVIEFHAIVRGGGEDGNKLGRTIGLFLVAIASFYTGGLAAAAYGQLTGAVVAAGVSIIGGLAVNALFPPPKPHTPDEGDTSPTYALSGGSNQMRRYEPMPHIIGTHKIFPDFGAQPYNEFRGEDQFAFYVFNVGYNDVTLSDFKLGDTPIEDFTGVILEVSHADGKLELFPGNVDTVAGEEITQAGSWVQRTSSDHATQLAVEISGLLFGISDKGDVIANGVSIEINYRKVGDSTWITSIVTSDEDPLFAQGGGWGDTIRVTREEAFINQLYGSPPGQIRIENASRKPLKRTYAWGVTEGQYEVRVRKLSLDSTNDRDIKDLLWTQLRTYQPDTANYSGQQRIALQVRATGQVSGSLPPFSCIARARALPPDFDWAGQDDAPSLAIDLLTGSFKIVATSESDVPRVIFTRAAGVATRVNPQGFIETVGTDVPRFDYDPVTKACKGLLVEETRTNRALRSSELDNSYWSKEGALTVDANVAVAPDNTLSADRLNDNSAVAWGLLTRSDFPVSANTPYCASVFVLKDSIPPDTRFCLLRIGFDAAGSNYIDLRFRTDTGAVSTTNPFSRTIHAAGSQDFGLFWRFWIAGESTVVGANAEVELYPAVGASATMSNYFASTTGSIVAWGLTWEQGAFPTSYIPTTDAVATRPYDRAILPSGEWFNESSFTITTEFIKPIVPYGGGISAFMVARTLTSRAAYITSGSSAVSGYDGTTVAGGHNITAGAVGRSAYAVDSGGQSISVNGGTTLSFAYDGTWNSGEAFGLGMDNSPQAHLNGHLRRVAFYSSKLSAATMQKLSTSGPAVFAKEDSSNPAWWYLEALRGRLQNGSKVYGANLPDSMIDLEGLQAFEDWCDSEGLTINAILDTQTSVYDVLQTIALMGRATPSWATGKLGVVWDAPNLPTTMVFGMHNIVAGSFEVNYATEDLAEVIEAEFINPDLDWQRDVVRVQVPGTTGQTKVRRVQLFGRTDKDLAAQDANLYAANNAYRNRKYKWTSDWETMPCARGDVVQISHDLASLDYSGRFVEGTTTTSLKLSKKVPLYAGGSFIVIVKPDGEMSTHTIAAGSGDTDTLTASPALPFNPGADTEHPPYDYKWIYGPTATPGKKLKIESFKPVSERYVEVSAVDEADYFYTAKDNPYTYVPPTPVFGQTPVIQGLTLTPEGVKSGKGYTVRVLVEWQVQGSYSTADVKVGIGTSSLVLVGRAIKGSVHEFLMTDDQDVTVEVTVYSDLGRVGSSAKATVTEHINFAALRAPGDVVSFTIAGDIFNWSEVTEVDVVGYQIRFHLGDKRTWEDASPMHEGLITEHEWQIPTTPLDDDVVTYLIKAVDAAGRYSVNPAILIKNLGDPPIANVVETVDYRDLAWPGTITGGTISGGDIVANTTALFYSGVDTDPLYTNDADPMYPATNYTALTYEATVLVPVSALQGSVITVQHVLQGDPHYLDWRQDGIGPFYGPDDVAAFYTADADPMYDVGEYMPWTGARVIESGDRYQFRARAAQGPIRGIFSELLVTIDAPDKEEEFNNLSISASGTRLPITLDYTSIKSVQGTLENDGGTAVTFTIEDRDPDLGPLIFARNSSLTAVTGRGDFRVKGW
jgi:hypothetical protein